MSTQPNIMIEIYLTNSNTEGKAKSCRKQMIVQACRSYVIRVIRPYCLEITGIKCGNHR